LLVCRLDFSAIAAQFYYSMPNGKPGDHPLSDIFLHKIEVYGPEADELMRKIGALCSHRELEEWWEREIGWSKKP
jgi:hypothetical protein